MSPPRRGRARGRLAAAATLVLGVAGLASGGSPARAAADDAARWRWDLAAGFESYLHTYNLATDDTTETITESMLQAGVEGNSGRHGPHRWRLRAEASLGTELARQRLEGAYRRLDADRATRLRATGRLWARQYRRSSEYLRTSDSVEGRGDLAWTPWRPGGHDVSLLGWGAANHYRHPSTLELNSRETGAGVAWRSGGLDLASWGLALRRGARAYADSAAIDRRSWSLEGDWERQSFAGSTWRIYQRSEHRHVRDETVRPHAWLHTDLHAALPAGRGRVLLEARSELWDYSRPSDVYLDTWLLDGFGGYGWGDPLGARWRLGLAAARLDVDGSPEAYTQVGLRAGAETYGDAVSGTLTVEYGRRFYVQDGTALPAAAGVLDGGDLAALYTDFHYWRLWLLGAWDVTADLSCEVMANYEPESHTEPTDDTALGFVSVRLVWRR